MIIAVTAPAPALDEVERCPKCLMDWHAGGRGMVPLYTYHPTLNECACLSSGMPVPPGAHMMRTCQRCGFFWAEQAGVRAPRAAVRPVTPPLPRWARDAEFMAPLVAADAIAWNDRYTGATHVEIHYSSGNCSKGKTRPTYEHTFGRIAWGAP